MANRQPNQRFKQLHEVSSTIFVSNFPKTTITKDLWQLCNRHGVVTDVYIARKLSKFGQRFGFVRFIKIKDLKTLIEDLNKIWIGNHHLFASKARFDRTHPNNTRQPNSQDQRMQEKKPLNNNAYQTRTSRSYAEMLNGKANAKKESSIQSIMKKVTLDNSDLMDCFELNHVVLVKVRDAHLIPNINHVLKKEGFVDCKCRYVGGLWIWIEFNNPLSNHLFKQNKEMAWYFTQVRSITKSFTVDEKLVWLEITGLPLHAWTTNAFKKIASVWGEPMFVDEDTNENMATGRVCIKTKVSGAISEVCSVVIKDITHQVHVKEFAGWSPDIDVASVVFDKVNDLDSTDNESDGNLSKEMQDDEEGVIKENDIDDGPALQSDQHHGDSNHSPNEEVAMENQLDDEEGEIKENDIDDGPALQSDQQHGDSNPSPNEEVAMENQLDDQVAKEEHLQTEASQHEENTQQSQTTTPSHPPGFEGFKVQSSRISLNKGNRSSKGHSSAFSFINDKVTKEGKSKSSSKLRSNGSLIEAFISHIEMGNVLGYDMEGSKADLKKFIDSIGANDIH
ncbi:hypothetical protein CTI12_AA070330 [Artemisia annua]|uniref:RRM domain-containing protein n=1 Tax=Artemisia annua TaxID=35608 RepID=A0A2U1Q603_ARTAN|nr:hypothetical protein CTI12_AA070330 [Artemisia annua]